MSSPAGIVAPPKLDGVELRRSARVTDVRRQEAKSVRETTTLRRYEARAWWGQAALENPGLLLPTRRYSHVITLDFSNLREDFDLVEELLAGPSPHSLAVWKPVTLSYVGDGVATELFLPWRDAVDQVGAPTEPPASLFLPVVKITLAGSPLSVSFEEQATYDAGPPAGSVFFLEGAQRARLGAAPLAGELVYVRIWPLLQVLEAETVERRYESRTVLREPRQIVLLEA